MSQQRSRHFRQGPRHPLPSCHLYQKDACSCPLWVATSCPQRRGHGASNSRPNWGIKEMRLQPIPPFWLSLAQDSEHGAQRWRKKGARRRQGEDRPPLSHPLPRHGAQVRPLQACSQGMFKNLPSPSHSSQLKESMGKRGFPGG